MYCDTQGFDQRTITKGDSVGQLIAALSGNPIIGAQGTVDGGCGSKLHGRAEIVSAAAAVRADVAGDSRFQGYTIVQFQSIDIASCSHDHARGLVAENKGLGDFVSTELSMLPVMDLREDGVRNSYLS